MADDGTAPRRANAKARILEWLEVLAKLLGASAVLVVDLFANSLQSKLTGVSIQSQREQAESQPRASMFNSLISPIAGPQTGDKPMPVDREVILTELLALNFNENFEMKPLMEDAIKRLSAEKPKSKEGEDPREALWSIARRIAERQKASISREWSASEAARSSRLFPFGWLLLPWKSAADSSRQGCQVYYLNLDARTERHAEPGSAAVDGEAACWFVYIIDLKLLYGYYTLCIWPVHSDWENQT